MKTPGVKSVRVVVKNKFSETYRLVDGSPGQQSEKATGYGLLQKGKDRNRSLISTANALEAEWKQMIANGRVLVKSDDKPVADFTLESADGPVDDQDAHMPAPARWSMEPSVPRRSSFTVLNGEAETILRKSTLEITALSAPLFIDFNGPLENVHFKWSRKAIRDKHRLPESRTSDLLLEHSNIARGVDTGQVIDDARASLQEALNNSDLKADNPSFALAAQWMESFCSKDKVMTEADRALALQIVADPRVKSANGFWAVAGQWDTDTVELRTRAAQRFLSTRDAAWVNHLKGLPQGAFANPLPEETAILSDPSKSRYVPTLIARQGERGEAAIPDLLRLLKEHATLDPGKNGYSYASEAINAVRRGLRRIGPAAAPARLEIEEVLNSEAMSRRYRGFDKRAWDVLPVVLGKPAETIVKPDNLSGTGRSYRNNVSVLAAREYDPSKDR